MVKVHHMYIPHIIYHCTLYEEWKKRNIKQDY